MRNQLVVIAMVVVGCATPPPETLPPASASDCTGGPAGPITAVDVAIAIDASSSTRFPSQTDVDHDGKTGRYTGGVVTDRDDSLLVAQIAEIRSLVQSATPYGARFSIVTYSGPKNLPVGLPVYAIVRSELTADPAQIDHGLGLALAGGSNGTSDFTGAMRRALQTLLDAPPERPETRRFIFLLSDSPHPILPQPYPLVKYPNNDPRMKSAAIRAIEAGVRIHTFALGDAAKAESPNALTRIAGATGGRYYPVERPDRLHCDLFAALAPAP